MLHFEESRAIIYTHIAHQTIEFKSTTTNTDLCHFWNGKKQLYNIINIYFFIISLLYLILFIYLLYFFLFYLNLLILKYILNYFLFILFKFIDLKIYILIKLFFHYYNYYFLQISVLLWT